MVKCASKRLKKEANRRIIFVERHDRRVARSAMYLLAELAEELGDGSRVVGVRLAGGVEGVLDFRGGTEKVGHVLSKVDGSVHQVGGGVDDAGGERRGGLLQGRRTREGRAVKGKKNEGGAGGGFTAGGKVGAPYVLRSPPRAPCFRTPVRPPLAPSPAAVAWPLRANKGQRSDRGKK